MRDDGRRVPGCSRPVWTASRSARSSPARTASSADVEVQVEAGSGPRYRHESGPYAWAAPHLASIHDHHRHHHRHNDRIPVRLDIDAHAAGFSRALSHLDRAATKELDRVDLDPKLRELLRIRASQLNGCAYCIDMHTKDARAIGETEQRIYALPAWAETPYFTPRERAALAFTESVTLVAVDHVPTAAYDAVAAEFSPDEVGALVALIVTVNAWNAVSVATRAWQPGATSR